jgi:hypothetical protein
VSNAGPIKTDAYSLDKFSSFAKILLSYEHRHPFTNNWKESYEHRYHSELYLPYEDLVKPRAQAQLRRCERGTT